MGKVRSVALAVALSWCVVLVAGAFVLPVYSSSGSAGDSSHTLVGENGVGVAGVIAVPLLVTGIVAAILWRRRTASNAGPAAWTIVGLMSVFNLLGMLTIGIFILPVTICLIVACAQHPRPGLGGGQQGSALGGLATK